MIDTRRFLCLLLVAFFAMGKAAHAWQGQGAAHLIEHKLASISEVGAHDHSHGDDHDTGQPLTDAEHLLIHLSPAMELAVFGAEPGCPVGPGRSVTLAVPPPVEPRQVALEPPLRPPRANA